MKRWPAAFGAVLIHLCLGVVFAWPAFIPRLCDRSGTYAFTDSQVRLVFSIGLLVIALAALGAGRIMAAIGSRKSAAIAGALLGCGYMLAGVFGSSFAAQLAFLGIMGGLGIGLGYVVPISVVIKWFPDRKGLITGLAVAGFGFGELIWLNSAGSWLDLLNVLNLFDLDGLRSTFLLYGIIFLVLILIGSRFMVDPPLGYSPPGWSNAPASERGTGGFNFDPTEMLRTPQFALLWAAFFLLTLAGLIVIGNIASFGVSALKDSGLETRLAVTGAEWAAAAVFVLNGLGRIVWGSVSDSIGRRWTICLVSIFQGVMMLLFYRMGSDPKFLILSACIIGFNFGGNIALFPAITADYFGNRNIALNLGYMLAAFCAAGLIGAPMAAYFKAAAQAGSSPSAWTWPFVTAGAACLAGAGLVFCANPPNKK